MKKSLLAGSLSFTLGLVLSFTPASEAEAGERVICTVTMPTDAGTASTADQYTDGGCTLFPDAGIDTCTDALTCTWGKAQNLFVQCDNPVYYSETPASTVNRFNQRNVRAATSGDVLIDFDANPDSYRINLRGQAQHISLLSVSTSANTCKVGTVERHIP